MISGKTEGSPGRLSAAPCLAVREAAGAGSAPPPHIYRVKPPITDTPKEDKPPNKGQG